MKQQREYPKITISRKAQAALEGGHPWVYGAEVRNTEGDIGNGGLVDVLSDKNRFLGTGLYSEKSKIRVRLISRNANDKFDAAFFERRLRYAWDYRKTVMGPDLEACRVIFGEADQFPGLTVDRYGDLLVTQTLSVGIERLKPLLFPLIYKILTGDGQNVRGIFERNDAAIRELEGLAQNKGWFELDSVPTPASPLTVIRENGVDYEVDVENGQKTGFFLDQKYNRRAVARLAGGKHVLDCFTHTGSFALNAARGGAASVRAVDVSESAVEMARRNAARNGLDGVMECTAADVFDLLTALEQTGEKPYDFIILDPPAFTKSRKTIDSALRGYKEINYKAMKLLPRGGYLATCSCSHFVGDELFRRMLRSAAADAAVELRQIEARQQSPDHPILWNVPETDYLKFYIFQVV
ncbi:23S rRNA (cytosine1962-C5)-methyltransferase [Sporobacter termitidis DSM 10068]|uniref:23S rRNA (Cytosine1962-C5)-methyltransferase n=1 Tax=Sporobacter termitidis DSM 10068 TaxID=1123282 RepID=A0A1M5WHX2_9FIRM|nr:class I SAM-dependent rRNA methyltransferase [Sporobacter termitidis]SHH87007.1 23S rRNA (cytosine1962-C5)-methyltransferase [Sporobacter termitidis DSM 10068]